MALVFGSSHPDGLTYDERLGGWETEDDCRGHGYQAGCPFGIFSHAKPRSFRVEGRNCGYCHERTFFRIQLPYFNAVLIRNVLISLRLLEFTSAATSMPSIAFERG
jgi:hypothetical protein